MCSAVKCAGRAPVSSPVEPFNAETFRRVRTAAWRPGAARLSWPTRLAFLVGAIVLALVAVVLIVPALFVGGLVYLAAAAVASVKRRFAGLRAPGGPLDGRRNVRVIVRDDPP